jgi:hypothetical protein
VPETFIEVKRKKAGEVIDVWIEKEKGFHESFLKLSSRD